MNPESKFLFPRPSGPYTVSYKLPPSDWVNWVGTPRKVSQQLSVAEAAAYLAMQAAIKKARRRIL